MRGTTPAPGPHTTRYGGHTMCLEVAGADGASCYLDAGSGLAPALRARSADTTGCPPVVLTHLHLDHLLGVPALISRPDGTAARLVSAGAPADAARAAVTALLTPPFFPDVGERAHRVPVDALDAGAVLAVGAHLRIDRLPARHPGGAAVLRVADARGTLLAFAPDNELDYANDDAAVATWRRDLAAALHGVPILLHDATWSEAELPERRGWGHSSALEATRFAMECEAGLLLLVHHHPTRCDEAVEALLARCRAHVREAGRPLRVLAAWEGLSLTA